MIAYADTRTLGNPITINSVPELLFTILNVVLIIIMPFIVFYLIWAGFQYVMARGKPEAIQKANRSLMFGLIGGVLVVGAFTILQIIGSIVEGFEPG